MLKRLAFILGFATVVFLMQEGLGLLGTYYPILVAPALVYIYPSLSFLYGYISYTHIRHWNILVVFISFLIFCFMQINMGSVIYSCYYAILCLVGNLLKVKLKR